MTSEVGSGQVAIFPTFKGFRKRVDDEVDASSKSAQSRFSAGFKSAGATSGKGFAAGFKSSGSIDGLLKSASAALAASARDVSAARLREQDATGKVRIAETQLAEARTRFASDSSRVVRAEERLATAERTLASTQAAVTTSSQRLAAAKNQLASASDSAAASGGRLGGSISRLPQIFGDAGSASGRIFSSGFFNILGGVVGANLVTGIGFAIGRDLGDGIRTGITYGLDSVQLASDLHETRSAVEQVYGDAAQDIEDFASTANQKLGQTQQQALTAAQTFGVFARQAGLTGKPLSTFSTGLVTLAGDLASFYNASPDDAIEAISAGLRGEAEPLRRFGVLLDDATLRQKALELGIYDGTDALTGQQRILAAQAVIFDQTGIAQGDFARTSDGLANQQRILAASLEDTQTKLGTALLPAFNSLASFANTTLVPALGGILDGVGPKLGQALTDAEPGFERLADKVAPLVDRLADAGIAAIPGFISGMNDMVDAAPGWIDALKGVNDVGNTLMDGVNAFFQSGADLHNTIADSLQASSPMVASLKEQYAEVEDATNISAEHVHGRWTRLFNEELPEVARIGRGGAFGAGKAYAEGLAEGIESSKGRAVAAARDLADSTVAASRFALRIASPSKVTREIGAQFTAGYVAGITSGLGDATAAVQRVSSILPDGSLGSVSVGAGGSSAASGMDRPIYADGSLFGWLREMANGEAQLVVAGYDSATVRKVGNGKRR